MFGNNFCRAFAGRRAWSQELEWPQRLTQSRKPSNKKYDTTDPTRLSRFNKTTFLLYKTLPENVLTIPMLGIRQSFPGTVPTTASTFLVKADLSQTMEASIDQISHRKWYYKLQQNQDCPNGNKDDSGRAGNTRNVHILSGYQTDPAPEPTRCSDSPHLQNPFPITIARIMTLYTAFEDLRRAQVVAAREPDGPHQAASTNPLAIRSTESTQKH